MQTIGIDVKKVPANSETFPLQTDRDWFAYDYVELRSGGGNVWRCLVDTNRYSI